MFRIEYEARGGLIGWLNTEYPNPEDADQIAKHLVDGTGEVIRTTVVEQAGNVYSEWVQS
jgi:hypothetical protein